MVKKTHYRTVFVSDIHLGHPKNQWDKFIEFLSSISFDNLFIVWDFIDYRQLNWFWKWGEKEQKTLNYINGLSKSWVNIVYIQWNHDRELKCTGKIKIENMVVCRDFYYKTLKWKTYYVTHWDCIDWVNKDGSKLWQLWSINFGLLLKIESLWNKKTFSNSYLSIAEKIEERIKKVRMPEQKLKNKIEKFIKGLNCDWIIIGHFHVVKSFEVSWLDCFVMWDWISNCSAVVEDNKWNFKLICYELS